MDILHTRCAALDISKKDVKACVRTPAKRRDQRHSEVRTFSTVTSALLQLRDWLIAEQVTLVVMEATGDYWRAPYYLLEDVLHVELVNAQHVKAVPGRKTDVSDAVWLCKVAECGLVRASFVPPQPIRRLRDLTRYRTVLIHERIREAQRLEKELEDAGIKLSAVATDLLGSSSRAILEALIAGERDPMALAELAQKRMRPKIPRLREALLGRFDDHHAFLCRLHLNRIDSLQADIDALSARITTALEPFRSAVDRLSTVPGISQRVAEVIIAETGADMSRFPTAGHLASWAGVCPGNNQSGSRRKKGRTRDGNHWLCGALGIAAMGAVQTKNTYIAAQYTRLARRLGSRQKALVAVEHGLLTSIWHMLSADVDYQDLGADYFIHRDPDRARQRAVQQLNRLGYTVRLDPISAA
jgi:transposase